MLDLNVCLEDNVTSEAGIDEGQVGQEEVHGYVECLLEPMVNGGEHIPNRVMKYTPGQSPKSAQRRLGV